MGGEVHSKNIGLDPGRELTGIQMPPPPVFPIVARDALLTLRAGVRARADIHGDGHLLAWHMPFHVEDTPGGLQPQDGLIEFEITHRSASPFGAPSIAQEESVTHSIS
jgi:hypothetical protein